MEDAGSAAADYQTVLLDCFDPRDRQCEIVRDALRRAGLVNGKLCRLSGVTGGAHPLSQGHPEVRAYFLRGLRIAVQHHGANRIIVVNHENCAMYDMDGCANDAPFHEREVSKACGLLRNAFPNGVEIRGFLCVRAHEGGGYCPELRAVYPNGKNTTPVPSSEHTDE